MIKRLLGLIGSLIGALLLGWSSLALWFDSPAPRIFLPLFLITALLSLLLMKTWSRRLFTVAALFSGVLWWWLGLQPSNSRDWQADVARLPYVDANGDSITFHNVRNFEYRSETDYTPHWEDRTLKLSDLTGADLYFSDWGAAGIVHTIVSWDFGPGKHIAVSIETRKKVGDTYSAIRGFFRQYELYYVVADERDVIGLRAKYRGEQLQLYRIRMSLPTAHRILESYIKNINQLQTTPKWYNALTLNCTTSIRLNVQTAGASKPLSWRHLANKYLDKLLYDYQAVNTSMPFEELKARSDITEVAIHAATDPNFSEIIRMNLPGRMPATD